MRMLAQQLQRLAVVNADLNLLHFCSVCLAVTLTLLARHGMSPYL